MAKSRKPRKHSSHKESDYLDLYSKHKPTEEQLSERIPALEHELIKLRTSEKAFEGYKIEYEKDQNPLFIWHTFQACLVAEKIFKDKQKPDYLLKAWEWVMTYFAKVAKNMIKGDDPKEIPQYLEFKKTQGGKSQFTQLKDRMLRERAVTLVIVKLKQDPGLSVDTACEEVAAEFPKFMRDGKTIKKWYYELTR